MSRKQYWMAGAVIAAGVFNGPAFAADKLCALAIAGNDLMQFDKKEMTVAPDCTQVKVTLTHTGKLPAAAMGHDWVLVKTEDVSAVANAGAAAGLSNNYVQPGDKRVVAATKVVGGGESTSVTFPVAALQKGQSYTYLCTFPGHNALMKGTLTIG
jgi:azurin